MALLALRPGVTSLTSGAHSVRFMATDAARHAGDTGVLGHSVKLRHLAVAHRALHTGRQMLAMSPHYPRRDLVDALPRNRRAAPRELRELLDCGSILGNGVMARHADAARRKRHLFSRIGIGVALPALQPQRNMSLVAVG